MQLFNNLGTSFNAFMTTLANDFLTWAPRIVLALIVMLVFLWLAGRLEKSVERLFKGRDLPSSTQLFFKRVTRLAAVLIGLAFALNLLGLGGFAAGLLASGSVVAIVLGFAFQQIGTNFLAGIFMVFNRPFDEGDFIEVSGLQGIVKEVDLRVTHIRNPDGRDIYIPNATIFTSPVTNYTLDDLRRYSFTVGIAYNDDAAAAIALLVETIRQTPGVLPEPTVGGGISELSGSWVTLQMYYWLSMENDYVKRTDVNADVMNRCRAALMDGGYTVSANCTTNWVLSGDKSMQPVHVVTDPTEQVPELEAAS